MPSVIMSAAVLWMCCLIANGVHWVQSVTISSSYIFENCINANQYSFAASSGGVLYWDQNQLNSSYTSSSTVYDQHILGCKILLRGRTPATTGSYYTYMALYWRNWSFDTSSATRAADAAANSVSQLSTIQAACGIACPTGCIIVTNPTSLVNTTYCGANGLQGTEESPYFKSDYVNLTVYMLGGYSQIVSNATGYNYTVYLVDPPTMRITIDYTTFFVGTCENNSTQYQCLSTYRCIDAKLNCDSYGSVNCGPAGSTFTLSDDQTYCASGSTVTATVTESTTSSSPLSIILPCAILIPLFLLLCYWCCYKPGYLYWRLARLRNCCCTTKRCNLCCIQTFTHGRGPNKCLCCRRASSGGCCACCSYSALEGSSGTSTGGRGGGALSGPSQSTSNGISHQEKGLGEGWGNYAYEDGLHVRELR